MAYSKVPTTWIPNWAESGGNITVPVASFPEMTAGEADEASGDIAEILFAICEQISSVWQATATADRPTGWTLSKALSPDVTTGKDTVQYVLRFVTSVPAGTRVVDAG